jgi:hypothetical protein
LRVRSSNNTSSADELESTTINSSTSAASLAVEDGRTDFSGVWKRIKLVNYENLLGELQPQLLLCDDHLLNMSPNSLHIDIINA